MGETSKAAEDERKGATTWRKKETARGKEQDFALGWRWKDDGKNVNT
jgi:hypothetical protein